MLITSSQNPKWKSALSLKEKRHRDASALFLIEGYRELKRAIEGGIVPQMLFVCPSFFLKNNEEALIESIERLGTALYEVPPALFEKLSYRDRPDGLVAVAPHMRRTLADLTFKKLPFLVIAEGIEKPGNLGTILRSADAAGVDGVIVADPCTDIYNPNVVRASVGTLFTLPVITASSHEVLEYLRSHKIQVIAATPSANCRFTAADFRIPLAIIVGTEQLGLSDFWIDAADLKVRIPMHGIADSLNVATATTLLLYEVERQRSS